MRTGGEGGNGSGDLLREIRWKENFRGGSVLDWMVDIWFWGGNLRIIKRMENKIGKWIVIYGCDKIDWNLEYNRDRKVEKEKKEE